MSDRLIENASEADCINFILHRSKSVIMAKTIAKDIAALNSFFRFLIIEGVRKDNPSESIERPKREKIPNQAPRSMIWRKLATQKVGEKDLIV